MFTTWTSANRYVDHPLMTTYSRQLVKVQTTSPGNNWHTSYWLYTRTRKKTYGYLGLTHAAAIACAKYMNLKYLRLVPSDWQWDDTEGANDFPFYWRPYSLTNIPTATPRDWEKWTGLHHWKEVKSADVTISRDGKDDRYSVEIEVDESLTARYSCIAPESVLESDFDDCNLLVWSAFESNPDLATGLFATGINSDSDFTYEE